MTYCLWNRGGEVEWAVSGRSGYEALLAVQRGREGGGSSGGEGVTRLAGGAGGGKGGSLLLLRLHFSILPIVFTTIHHTFRLF